MEQSTLADSWTNSSYDYLIAEIDKIRRILKKYIAHRAHFSPKKEMESLQSEQQTYNEQPSFLSIVTDTFGLSQFDKQILVLCAAVEIDPEFAGLCADAQGREEYCYPTFHLASALFGGDLILGPETPLRYWQLVEIEDSPNLNYRPLRISEWAMNCLAGRASLDKRLLFFLKQIQLSLPVFKSHLSSAEYIINHWNAVNDNSELPVIQLVGKDITSRRQLVTLASQPYKVPVFELDLYHLPFNGLDLSDCSRLLEREIFINEGIYLIDCERLLENKQDTEWHQVKYLLENLAARLSANCILAASQPLRGLKIKIRTIYSDLLQTDDQSQLWLQLLGETDNRIKTEIEKITQQFTFTAAQISSITEELLQQPIEHVDLVERLWQQCRQQQS